jgi:hypothetical protein
MGIRPALCEHRASSAPTGKRPFPSRLRTPGNANRHLARQGIFGMGLAPFAPIADSHGLRSGEPTSEPRFNFPAIPFPDRRRRVFVAAALWRALLPSPTR